ncbi:MAG: iron ABC transporter permease [Deltaproteobacteria bacterium]|nr:iron ABC transporter permease [Deltaproteobacteria bacterium]
MRKVQHYLVYLIVLNILMFCLSMFLGRYHIPMGEVINAIFSPIITSGSEPSRIVTTVLFHVRLPRILLAMLIGAGLGITGASFQGIFRNPLVSPYILGVSSGGGFGAALAILLFNSPMAIQILAFVFGMLAVGITYFIALLGYRISTYTLVLAGIVVGSFFTALISLLKYVADIYTKLPAIVFWLMGSLAAVDISDMLRTGPIIAVCIIVLIMLRWRFNILSLGSQEAKTLGINTTVLYLVIITLSTVIAASIVAIAGIIGWVGLVVPHLCRMMVGADHEKLLPASALMGSAYMLMVDDVARTLVSQEIPLGIVTAIIGAPFFAYLLKRRRGGKP